MRLILGIIIGIALTIGAAFISDSMAAPGQQTMVNWSVVGKNFETITNLVRDGWRKIVPQ